MSQGGEKFVVSMDASTSAVKVMAYSVLGTILHITKVAIHYLDLPEGRREIDPVVLIDAVRQAFNRLWSESQLNPKNCVAFAVGGAMHGMCLVDEDGNFGPNIICWDDPRHVDISEELSRHLNLPIPNRFTACRVAGWFRDNSSSDFVPKRVFTPSGFILSRIVGPENASTLFGDFTGMVGYQSNPLLSNHEEITDAMTAISPTAKGFIRMLPSVMTFGQISGRVNPAGSKLTGLPVGTPCAPSCGDQPLGSVGKGCTRKGDISKELGSSIVANFFGFDPIFDQLGLIEALRSSLCENHAMCCVTNGCQSWDDFVEALVAFANSVSSRQWNEGSMLKFLEEKLPSTRPGADGLIALPFFRQEGALKLFGSNVSPGFLGISATNFTPQNMARAWMEAPILILKSAFDMITRNQDVSRVIVSGGGARGYWPQIVADILQMPVSVTETTEAVLMGAAMNALALHNGIPSGNIPDFVDSYVKMGRTLQPNREVATQYQEVAKQFTAATQGLKPFWRAA